MLLAWQFKTPRHCPQSAFMNCSDAWPLCHFHSVSLHHGLCIFFRLALLSEENLPELLRKALQARKEEQEREGMLSDEGAARLTKPAC